MVKTKRGKNISYWTEQQHGTWRIHYGFESWIKGTDRLALGVPTQITSKKFHIKPYFWYIVSCKLFLVHLSLKNNLNYVCYILNLAVCIYAYSYLSSVNILTIGIGSYRKYNSKVIVIICKVGSAWSGCGRYWWNLNSHSFSFKFESAIVCLLWMSGSSDRESWRSNHSPTILSSIH